MAVVDVVKYNGKSDTLVWKYPSEELGTWTQLIVNESQEAILLKGGQVCDVFGPGRHVLETANIPILNKIINLPFGGRSPFTAEVWFVNKTYNLDVKWGTPTPIQIQDPKYGIFCPVSVYGSFGIQVEDAKKFLIKIVGTNASFDTDALKRYFRGLYVSKVKDSVSNYLVNKGISILEINAYIDELSGWMSERIAPTMEEYGIKLPMFFVNGISVPEDDKAVRRLKDALSKRAEMDIIGFNYQQERSFDTLEGAAKNEGGGVAPLMGAGLGIGAGFGMGGAVGSGFADMAKHIDTSNSEPIATETICPDCGTKIQGSPKHCPECGKSLVKTCLKCGTAINGKPKFCPECGESLMRICSNCGSVLDDNAKFCMECGHKA